MLGGIATDFAFEILHVTKKSATGSQLVIRNKGKASMTIGSKTEKFIVL